MVAVNDLTGVWRRMWRNSELASTIRAKSALPMNSWRRRGSDWERWAVNSRLTERAWVRERAAIFLAEAQTSAQSRLQQLLERVGRRQMQDHAVFVFFDLNRNLEKLRNDR